MCYAVYATAVSVREADGTRKRHGRKLPAERLSVRNPFLARKLGYDNGGEHKNTAEYLHGAEPFV